MNSGVFPKFAVFMNPLGVIVPALLIRNHFLVSLPKKQQDDIVQPFGHFR